MPWLFSANGLDWYVLFFRGMKKRFDVWRHVVEAAFFCACDGEVHGRE
jgi:hypothetical protein